ncbi:hypothetical protein GCM10009739_19110 [Microbacterium ulmi]
MDAGDHAPHGASRELGTGTGTATIRAVLSIAAACGSVRATGARADIARVREVPVRCPRREISSISSIGSLEHTFYDVTMRAIMRNETLPREQGDELASLVRRLLDEPIPLTEAVG